MTPHARHRLAFRRARQLGELRRVEADVIPKRWTRKRSARLDRALVRWDRAEARLRRIKAA